MTHEQLFDFCQCFLNDRGSSSNESKLMFYMRHSTPWKENNNMLIQLVTLLYAILLPSSLSNLDSWWLFMTFSCRGQTWEMRDAHLTVAVFMLPSLCLINMRLCTNDRDTWPRRLRSQSYDSLPRPHSVLSPWILSVSCCTFYAKHNPGAEDWSTGSTVCTVFICAGRSGTE